MTPSEKLESNLSNKSKALENRFDRSKFNFYSNSAYRHAKQQELLMIDYELKFTKIMKK
ncbi:hypothetical protein GALL_18550 [mine drainage metagenome]|uniref:Uncharacterized protein n=1 Tax=mine drainage metagenome TaxID=410659 RepID=A0A1J5TMT4_9ZZZZ